jgi:hypothetical protein
VLLCADDFGLSEGVSRGIAELARLGRISATSAIVTRPRWAEDGPRLASLKDMVAVGLHLNLTLGAPLGPMPTLCPSGSLPPISDVMRKALCARIDVAEVEAETLRQLATFEAAVGAKPDFLDGHQHVHTLAGVRRGVLRALEAYDPARTILVRDPAESVPAIIARGQCSAKAMAVALLAMGFGGEARKRGFPTNTSFAGFSDFIAGSPYADELERSFRAAGPRHIVMCHPGYPDAELKALDPVHARRREELEALRTCPWLARRILLPKRDRDGRVRLFGTDAEA